MRAGAGALSLDATLLGPRDDEAVGEALEAGVGLLLGLVPSDGAPAASGAGVSDLGATMAPAVALWRRLGFAPELLATSVVVTTTCGLAGASGDWARQALRLSATVARNL